MRRRRFLELLTLGLAGLAGGLVTLSSSDDKERTPRSASMTTDEFDQLLQEDVERRWELEHQREPVFHDLLMEDLEGVQRTYNGLLGSTLDAWR